MKQKEGLDNMVDKVVKFKNDEEYLILDETILDNKKYYLGIKVIDKDQPTSVYLFFEEIDNNGKLILKPIWDEDMKGLLLTSFTVNFLEMTYREKEGDE